LVSTVSNPFCGPGSEVLLHLRGHSFIRRPNSIKHILINQVFFDKLSRQKS
jgi:hypothetical protein